MTTATLLDKKGNIVGQFNLEGAEIPEAILLGDQVFANKRSITRLQADIRYNQLEPVHRITLDKPAEMRGGSDANG